MKSFSLLHILGAFVLMLAVLGGGMACAGAPEASNGFEVLKRTNLPPNHYLTLEAGHFALQVKSLAQKHLGWQDTEPNELVFTAERVWKSEGAQEKFLSNQELLTIFRFQTLGKEVAIRGFYDQFNRIEVELVETGPIGSLSWGTYVPFGSACDRADDEPKKERCVRNDFNNTVKCGGTTYYDGGGGTYESEDGKKIQECENSKDKTVYVDVRLGDDECDGCTPHGKAGAPAGG